MSNHWNLFSIIILLVTILLAKGNLMVVVGRSNQDQPTRNLYRWYSLRTNLLGATPNSSCRFVECLKCVACDSLHQPKCVTGDMPLKKCAMNETHCLKMYADVKDGLVYRSCSLGTEMPGCKHVMMKGINVKVCTNICQTDGCNSAYSFLRPSSWTFVPFMATCLLISAFIDFCFDVFT